MDLEAWECWPVLACDPDCEDRLNELGDELRLNVERQAAYWLWALSGRRYGVCPVRVWPCRETCAESPEWAGVVRGPGQSLVNLSCGACAGVCGCSEVSELIIPHTRAVRVVDLGDGVVRDPASVVAVFDHRRIVRVDGGAWPVCQDWAAGGSWSLTVEVGHPLPPGAGLMAGRLACELARACAGDSGCGLPEGVQSVSRQGVTLSFQDQQQVFDGFGWSTGLGDVDRWLRMLTQPARGLARVIIPDRGRPSVRSWPVSV